MIREGEGATYIGTRLAVGERCYVLSTEATYANVKWLTGPRAGSIEPVPNQDLAPDRKVRYAAWDDDPFGFEAPVERISAVRVATAQVHARGGTEGLLRALDNDGMVAGVRTMVMGALRQVRTALSQDPAWREVVSELGEHGTTFVDTVLREAVTASLDGGWDGSQEEG